MSAIYGTDLTKPISVILKEIRTNLNQLRGNISDISHAKLLCSDRVDYLDGYFTTGIIAIHDSINQIRKIEIRLDDVNFGNSIHFLSRGIGTDICPGCFVCSGEKTMLGNISGYVNSMKDGEDIVAMFDHGVRLDYRKNEPNRIQVKIGACKKHIPNLEKLEKLCSVHNVIRKSMITESMKLGD